MPFVEIDRNNSSAPFAQELVQAVSYLNLFYAVVERTQERMDEMEAAQIETLYGLPADKGTTVKDQIDAVFNALETDAALVNLRTRLG